MNCLSPSILAADFSILGEQVKLADEAGATHIHIDIMDGAFVEELSFGTPVIKSIRKCTTKLFDVHLMVEEPIRFVSVMANAGADIITVHAEACKNLDKTIDEIHKVGKRAGVALNPETPIDCITNVLHKVDMVLVMTVNPGKGGQKLIPYTISKVTELKQLLDSQNLSIDIEVDGGVKLDNVEEVLKAGANIVVAGSAVFAGDIQENVKAFLEVINC